MKILPFVTDSTLRRGVVFKNEAGLTVYDIRVAEDGVSLEIRAVNAISDRHSGSLVVVPCADNTVVLRQRKYALGPDSIERLLKEHGLKLTKADRRGENAGTSAALVLASAMRLRDEERGP